jgi:hypothetical protein
MVDNAKIVQRGLGDKPKAVLYDELEKVKNEAKT